MLSGAMRNMMRNPTTMGCAALLVLVARMSSAQSFPTFPTDADRDGFFDFEDNCVNSASSDER